MISNFLKLFHHSFSMTLSIFHYTFNYSIHYYESRRERQRDQLPCLHLLTSRMMTVHKSAICRFNGVKFETFINLISQLLIDYFFQCIDSIKWNKAYIFTFIRIIRKYIIYSHINARSLDYTYFIYL